MDGGRFDNHVRSLGDARSRRGVLAGLAGLAAGLIGTRTVAACPPE